MTTMAMVATCHKSVCAMPSTEQHTLIAAISATYVLLWRSSLARGGPA